MFMATAKTISHSDDLKLAKRFNKFIDGCEINENVKWYIKQEVTYNSLEGAHEFAYLSDEDKYYSVAQGLGSFLMSGSFYDENHNNYTDHNDIVKKILKEFTDVPAIHALCTLFLNPNRDQDTFNKIRKLTWANCADWTK